MKPFIGITIGDPAGIGPEIALKAALSPQARKLCKPLLIGPRDIWEQAAKSLGQSLKGLEIHDIYCERYSLVPGKTSSQSGGIAARSVIAGALLALDGQISALATAPISKSALHQAGYKQPGHTELLAEICGVNQFAMMFAAGCCKLTLATIHLPYAAVPKTLTPAMIKEKIILTADALKSWWRIKRPVIAVLGLNPHAGEDGLFGSEEKRIILPGIKSARNCGCRLLGPLSAEAAFDLARQGQVHALIAMYHDQGLLPLKALGGAVNITLGLPFVRTSPDHGTALDIAWQNRADHKPMLNALSLASELSGRNQKKYSTG
jgi:4-hydroxythreonine-4-phosphate dehydrogenase